MTKKLPKISLTKIMKIITIAVFASCAVAIALTVWFTTRTLNGTVTSGTNSPGQPSRPQVLNVELLETLQKRIQAKKTAAPIDLVNFHDPFVAAAPAPQPAPATPPQPEPTEPTATTPPPAAP